MNRKELTELLHKERIHQRFLCDEWQDDSIVLYHNYVTWEVYYAGDGIRNCLKVCYSEDEACNFIYRYMTSFRRDTQKKLWPHEKSIEDYPKELWIKYDIFWRLNSIVDMEFIPQNIIALYFEVKKDFRGYLIDIIGSRYYDENDDSWINEIWYKPYYYRCRFETIINEDGLLNEIISRLKEYLQYIKDTEYDIFKDKIITVGFKGESMTRIQ
jgi:hypothetical protein